MTEKNLITKLSRSHAERMESTGLTVGMVGFGVVGSATANGLWTFGNEIIANDIRDPEGLDGFREDFMYRRGDDYRIEEADATMLVLPTPVDKKKFGGKIDTHLLDDRIEGLGLQLKDLDRYHVFIIRSTVLPGTTERYVERLAEISGKKPGRDFGAAMNPEFLRAFNKMDDFFCAPLIVVGQLDERSGDLVEKIYENAHRIEDGQELGAVRRYTLKQAEMIKYLSNIFNAAKISFMNWAEHVSGQLGVTRSYEEFEDMAEVMRAMTEGLTNPEYGTHPGLPYGGTCLPKDTFAMHTHLSEKGIESGILGETIRMNEIMKGKSPDGAAKRQYFKRRMHSTYDNIPP